jgi:hypothetical protein
MKLAILRHRLLQRAGRLTQASNRLTLTFSNNETAKNEIFYFIEALTKAA